MKKKLIRQTFSIICAGLMSTVSMPMEVFAEESNNLFSVINLKKLVTEKDSASASKNESGKIYSGDVNNDGGIDSADADALLALVEAGTASGVPQADVNGDGKIDNLDISLISDFAEGKIKYFPVGDVFSKDSAFITRAEWIHDLVEGFEMTVEKPETMSKYFTDIEGNDYEYDINLAANFGVFEIESDKFNPSGFVTRDFMSHTMNYCLGFPDDVKPIFSDANDAAHPGDDQVSVNRGWISLVGEDYRPDLYVLKDEVAAAIADKDSIENEVVISSDHKDVIESSEKIIKITDAESCSLSGNYITVSGSKTKISEGDYFSVVLNGNEVVRKAVKINPEISTGEKVLLPDNMNVGVKEGSEGYKSNYAEFKPQGAKTATLYIKLDEYANEITGGFITNNEVSKEFKHAAASAGTELSFTYDIPSDAGETVSADVWWPQKVTIEKVVLDEGVEQSVSAPVLDPDTMLIETEIPESEVITKEDAAGFAYIDYDNIKILSDDIKFEIEDIAGTFPVDNAKSSSGSEVVGYDYQRAGKVIENAIDINTKKLKFTVPHTDEKVTAEISKLSVPYLIDLEKGDLKKFKVGVIAETKIVGTVLKKDIKPMEIPMAEIPVVASGFLNIKVRMSILVSVSGEIKITYTAEANGMAEYTKANGWRIDKNFVSKGFELEAKAEEKIAVKLSVRATMGLDIQKILKVPTEKLIGEIYVLAGEEGKAVYKKRSNGTSCANIAVYCVAEVGAKLEFPRNFSKTYRFIDASNSPFFFGWHYENDNLVKNCNFGDQYGRSAYNTGGGSWDSSYSSYTGMFAELAPPGIISSNTVLAEDTTFYNGLVINSNAKLDLNGHKLTVKGDLTIADNAHLYFNGGSAEITGKYNHTGGGLIMDNKKDYMLVEGDSEIRGGNVITAGTIEFKGDITGKALDARDMNKVILSSSNDQTINISSSDTFFNLLEVKNSEKRNIFVYQYLNVSNSFVTDGKSLNIICNENGNKNSVFQVAEFSGEKINVTGDIVMHSCSFKLKEFNVDGNLVIKNYQFGPDGAKAYFSLNETTLNVKGDFGGKDIGNASHFKMNSGSIYTGGNFSLNSYGGSFVMDSKQNKISVGGDLYIINYAADKEDISNGTIEVKGDITLKNAHFIDSNHLILSGDKDSELFIEDASVNNLDIQNSDKKNITLGGTVRVINTDCGDKPLSIVCTKNTTAVSLGTLKCSELTVDGDISIGSVNKFLCKKALFKNNLYFIGSDSGNLINLNGCETVITGTFDHNSYGTLDLATAKMTAGKVNIQRGTVKINKGTLMVNEDMTVNGYINMVNPEDSIIVKGNLDIDDKGTANVKAGSVTLCGDYSTEKEGLYSESGNNFKFILAGEKEQTLEIKGSLKNNYSNFNELEIKNSDARKIILKGYLDTETYKIDGKTLNLESRNGCLSNLKLVTPVNVDGNIAVDVKSVNLNGNELKVSGNLIHKGGTLQVNTGKLVVDDYLMVTDEDSAVYGVSSGILDMTHDNDYVLVNGNFTTNTKNDHSKYLTNGILEIKKDFRQLKGGTESAFPASGKHKVYLSGDAVQNVTFESYDKSHFNELILKNAAENYKFSDNPCWTALSSGEVVVPPVTEVSPAVTTAVQGSEIPAATTAAQNSEVPATTTAAAQSSEVPATTAVQSSEVPATTTAVQNSEAPVTTIAVQSSEVPATTTAVQNSEVPATTTAVQSSEVPATTTAVQSSEVPATTTSVQSSEAPATTTAAQNSEVPAADYVPGDANGDGKVTMHDRILLSRYIADNGYNEAGYAAKVYEPACDVNGDGKITLVDAILIARYIADNGTNPNGYNVVLLPSPMAS